MAEIWRMRADEAPNVFGALYERLLDGLERGDLGGVVLDTLTSEVGGVTRLYLFEASGSDESRLHYHFCEPDIAALFPIYSHAYRRIDPVCEAYRFAPATGDIAIQRVAGADVRIPGFRRRFFEDGGIVERVSIIQRGPSQWRGMNVARNARLGRFTDDELNVLLSLARLALPLLPLSAARKGMPDRPTFADFERRFAAQFPALPERERQVCARAACGMSVEATALDLGIGKASVLTYRRRAYQRLSVSSPFELSALVAH